MYLGLAVALATWYNTLFSLLTVVFLLLIQFSPFPLVFVYNFARLWITAGMALVQRFAFRSPLWLHQEGFPEKFIFPVTDNKALELLGNSVAVPVLKKIAGQIAATGIFENGFLR